MTKKIGLGALAVLAVLGLIVWATRRASAAQALNSDVAGTGSAPLGQRYPEPPTATSSTLARLRRDAAQSLQVVTNTFSPAPSMTPYHPPALTTSGAPVYNSDGSLTTAAQAEIAQNPEARSGRAAF
jgi:hypothetical protein